MARRHNHYDAAFEAYLRDRRTPYVVVDERRRALLHRSSLKSMDFIVYTPGGVNMLVDVKGRRFPAGGSGGHTWENWATEDDLASLLEWQRIFGDDFRAALVFAYHVLGEQHRFDAPFECRNRFYAFYAVWADEYLPSMRTRSPSWGTVSIPSRKFRDLRTPIAEFLDPQSRQGRAGDGELHPRTVLTGTAS